MKLACVFAFEFLSVVKCNFITNLQLTPSPPGGGGGWVIYYLIYHDRIGQIFRVNKNWKYLRLDLEKINYIM